MNPFNLLINYVIANSRASFYNVSGNQEITNTALLAGVVSENPLLSYLLIENKAKAEGDKFIANKVIETEISTIPGTSSTGSSTAGNSSEGTKGTETGGGTAVNAVTLEVLETKISENTAILRNEIARISDNNKSELEKIIAGTLKPKIEGLEKSNAELSIVIQSINNRLDAISKTAAASEASVVSEQKSPVKNVKR